MKSIAISQSNYIPWKGYFDIIQAVDEYVIYDDVQYTRRDWRNRNKIKTPQGLTWLTVPVLSKGNYYESIKNIRIDGTSWSKNHLSSLSQNYRKSKFFDEIFELILPVYSRKIDFLSDLNLQLINVVCDYLAIKTKITNSSDYTVTGDPTQRLINICMQSQASKYISGPSAKNYLDENKFIEAGINLEYVSYNNYLKYNQLWGEFIHEVSIIDLLFCCGKESIKYYKSMGIKLNNEIINSHNSL